MIMINNPGNSKIKETKKGTYKPVKSEPLNKEDNQITQLLDSLLMKSSTSKDIAKELLISSN